MEVVCLNLYFDELFIEFSFDDGGFEYDWSKIFNDYFDVEWWDNIIKVVNIDEFFKIF